MTALRKLTKSDIADIRARRLTGETVRAIAVDFPVTYGHVAYICKDIDVDCRRKTHCMRGHLLPDVKAPRDGRRCAPCANERKRKFKARWGRKKPDRKVLIAMRARALSARVRANVALQQAEAPGR